MANIGTTTAFYKVETSLTRANTEVSKSMERLATGRQNANAGDRSSYVAMSDTFRMDFVGTKAGIKGGTVVMGYLETGMRVLDAASALLSRLQELAVLGANRTNTVADHEAINLEAEALGDEFNRLMTTSKYKGKGIFVSTAGSEYVSMGGRDAEMTFGIGTITYTELYGSANRTIAGGPNDTDTVNLKHLPSDAVAAKKYGVNTDNPLLAGIKYEVVSMGTSDGNTGTAGSDAKKILDETDFTGTPLAVGSQFTVNSDADITNITSGTNMTFKRVSGTNALTEDIEAVQAKINTARVQAGSQYAAIENDSSHAEPRVPSYVFV